MASAALNSGLLEALVSRGTTPHVTGRDAHPRPPPSPNTAVEVPSVAHHSYLHAHFQAVASHYGGDPHEMSTSGGDATTEDDEASLNDQLTHFYSKSSLGDDLLSASAKKRRKQSKPVRLPTPQGEPGDGEEQTEIKTEETQFDSEMSNPSAEGDEGLTCSYCHLQAPSEDSLRRHIIEEHIGRLLSDDEARQQQHHQKQEPVELLKGEDGATPLNLSSPRWEGGGPPTRPQEEDGRSPPTSIPMPSSFGEMKFNLPGLLPLAPPHFLLPFLQQAEHERLSAGHTPQNNSSPSFSANGQQHRIFNQQAYCDLCNKEFCNKYFLKTHKANKHGIYSPEFSSSPTNMTTGHTTPLGPSVPLASPLGPSLGSGGLVGSPYAGAFIAATMNSLPLRPPLLPTHPGASKPIPMPKTEPGSSSSSSNSKAGGVINLEAYCELCQKEFCNKYFLKRHKSKIHGITIDVVTKPKTPGQVPVRLAPDRPEGWCDACRRDIGGRAPLNAHKLQVHGPHIVAPLPSPHSTSPHPLKNPRTPTPNNGRKSSPDHRDPRDYFSPWESLKDPREQSREPWDSGKDIGELPREARDPSRDTMARSPWERPLGSPWDIVRELPRVPDGPRTSPKDNIQRSESWSKQEHRSSDHYNHRDDRDGPLAHLDRLPDSHDFPLDARDMQTMREEQQREWEMQQRDLEQQHRERVQQQYLERERQQREREMQQRERDQWEHERERERNLYREQQLEREQYEREQRERILMDRQRELEQHHEEIRRENEAEGNRDSLYQDDEGRQREGQQSDSEAKDHEKGESNDLQHTQEDTEEHQGRADGREGEQLKQESGGDSERRKEGPENREVPKDQEGEVDGREKGYEGREGGPKTHGGSDGHEESFRAREGSTGGREGSLGGREGSLGGREGSIGGREGSIGGHEGSLEGREAGLDGREINRDPLRDGYRTPGGSSADESSRETGLIARVGQPAMVQAPPGTKFTPEQLRQLGVINPDAFCELCCKEFCNKYFLRTHRIKKHGIYTPEFSDRSKSQQKESSPMNLARLLERQSLYARPTLPDIESDLECDICRRPFPNPYVLQMHKYYFHGSSQESGHQEQFNLYPHQSPHEQLRQLALHAQQQARQQQQHHQKRIQEQQKHLEHQQRLQKQEEEQREQARLERERPTLVVTSEDGQGERGEDPPRPSVIESAGSGESDASEDLRKLQSMILQLNRQGEMGLRCRLCNKDVGNKYFLRAHMMTEHGILGHEEVSAPPSEAAQTPKTPREPTPKVSVSPPPTPLSGENQAFCNICKKDFFSRYILQQHMLSAHGVFTPPAPPTSFMERIRAEVESREERKPQSTSRSYCEICNKELCNKYFMKTHMLKMHGINVENGVSGGVTCDLCNKELCSKYFLRVHKQNTHGMVEEGRESDEGIVKSEIESCPLCSRRFKNRKWLKTHLTSDHDDEGKEKWQEVEASTVVREGGQQNGSACGLCGHVVPDLVALQLHVIKMHGTPVETMNTDSQTIDDTRIRSLQCSLCPFTAPSPALLFAHARTHAPGMPPLPGMLGQSFPCPLCSQVLPNFEAYQHHLIQHQLQGFLKPLLEKDNSSEPNAPKPFKAPEESSEEAAPRAPPAKRKKRWRCSQCGRRFKSRALCLAHVHATHNPRARGTWLGRPAVHRRLFKCRKCGAVAQRLTALRQHIREQHQVGSGVPTSHATPTKPRAAGRFVMQPFLLNNEGSEGGDEGEKEEERQSERRQFVPSLVYLPVARRVHRPLTVSFSLTPA
ncbi:uncharacterized protein LOC121856675 [Homarus americanus]|uniref:Zinc finger protein 142-like n=1 Tax=Homarus americanus TaxID=6706 RepID=A0A8J5J8B4_HOMAM|nr:uncharacterized protein LOC121856675 [Homarus americanus]KAG7154111.1 Zinc finger protein 142-like [Homarus americanus]